MPHITEKWMPIVGYDEAYEVSTSGLVRSLDRIVVYKTGRSVPIKGRLIRPAITPCGHLQVALSKSNTSKTRLVHQIVAEAFIGPRPNGMEIRHLDGIGTNNQVENLCYGTHFENMQDRTRHGTCPQSNRTHCPQGHPYSADNTAFKSNRRVCITCRRKKDRELKRALRLKARLAA